MTRDQLSNRDAASVFVDITQRTGSHLSKGNPQNTNYCSIFGPGSVVEPGGNPSSNVQREDKPKHQQVLAIDLGVPICTAIPDDEDGKPLERDTQGLKRKESLYKRHKRPPTPLDVPAAIGAAALAAKYKPAADLALPATVAEVEVMEPEEVKEEAIPVKRNRPFKRLVESARKMFGGMRKDEKGFKEKKEQRRNFKGDRRKIILKEEEKSKSW